eukprot:SAG22_NODE_48_length_24654_cov_4.406394_4_plen_99_part_00
MLLLSFYLRQCLSLLFVCHHQDVAWVPGNMQFVALYGFMPATATMFDKKCKPIFTYGTGYRNTIKVSCQPDLRLRPAPPRAHVLSISFVWAAWLSLCK